MLASQKRRRLARVLIVSSDSEDDIHISKSDSDNYEPSPLKKRKWVQIVRFSVAWIISFCLICRVSKERATSKKTTPTKTRRKLPTVKQIETVSSDSENQIDSSQKTIARVRKTARKTSESIIPKKRKKAEVTSIEIVDGSSHSKMGLKSSKGAKVKPIATETQDAEPKPKNVTATGISWTAEQLLSNLQNIDLATSANIIRLFDEDNTIPFICRYRRELTGNIEPDRWGLWK